MNVFHIYNGAVVKQYGDQNYELIDSHTKPMGCFFLLKNALPTLKTKFVFESKQGTLPFVYGEDTVYQSNIQFGNGGYNIFTNESFANNSSFNARLSNIYGLSSP